uniref:CRAL-TRIO domain-containing protein n=1 Tax=Paramoeba aestuarina TaxID=180227 RepID=A0A7S4L5T1_9EUKA
MSDVDNDQYPERLGSLVVVNAPKALAVSWAIIRSWLDKRTQQKIQILHGRDEYLPVLTAMIDEDVIPVEYGGKGENLKGKKEAQMGESE